MNLIGLLIGAAAWAQDSAGDAAEVEQREAALGLVRVENGDGTWSYAAPAETPAEQSTGGGVTLRYDGQEAFADEPVPNVGTVKWVEPDYVLTGLEFDPYAYLDFRVVDSLGRRWVVSDLDVDLLQANLLAEREAATGADALALDTGYLGDPPGIEWNPDAGTEHELELTSFTATTCSGSIAFWQNVQNGNMIQLSTTAPMDATQRKAVMVRTWTGTGNLACSGVLIRDDAVLTAAHCVTDSNHSWYPAANLTVCTMGNRDAEESNGLVPGCYAVAQGVAAAGWTGTTTYLLDQDYAVLFLDRPTHLGGMPITTQSDAAVMGNSDLHLGYPATDTSCTSNLSTNDCERTDNRFPASDLYQAIGAVSAMPTGYAQWDTSFAGATSGGPHYLCVGGNCATPQLTGIQAAAQNMCGGVFPCATGKGAGPKASAFGTYVNTALSLRAVPVVCPTLGMGETNFTANPPATPSAINPADFSPTCQASTNPGYGTSICQNTQVYRPPAALGCTAQSKLVVFLPGTDAAPRDNDFPLEYSAYAGFRTIGLSYGNHWDTSSWCTERATLTGDPKTTVCYDAVSTDSILTYKDECAYWMRQERVTGKDDPLSSYDALLPYTSTDQRSGFDYLDGFPNQDSVLYRLLYTLIRLRQQDSLNTCQWDSFYDPNGLDGQIHWSGTGSGLSITGLAGQMNVIKWDKIIVAGWSQGAGHAVWIDLMQKVGGLFVLDGPSDMCLKTPAVQTDGRGASYYGALVDGVHEPSEAAPRFGVYHEESPAPPGALVWPYTPDANRPVAWDNQFPGHADPVKGLRMPSCDDQDWDATVAGGEPAPPSTLGVPWLKRSPYPAIGTTVVPFTQISLHTDQATGGGACGPHESVALSHRTGSGATTPNCMTDGVGGQASSPEQANLFEAYVQGFCALGEP